MINVSLARCRGLNHLAFPCARDSGHPFIATIEAQLTGNLTSHSASPLEQFYRLWTPHNAAEALGLLDESPATPMLQSPPYGATLPWFNIGPHEASKYIAEAILKENASFGMNFGIEEGCSTVGPMSARKIELEHRRLVGVTKSIQKQGFRCDSREYIRGYLLINDKSYAVSLRQGQHRAAALAALGYSSAPVMIRTSPFVRTFSVHRTDVESWPNVKNGLFSVKQALELFDRIFDGRQPTNALLPSQEKYGST